jgi:hypothetical protein
MAEEERSELIEMELGDVKIRVLRVEEGVEFVRPHEMSYAAEVKVDYDEIEFAFIAPSNLTDHQVIIVTLAWFFDALAMGLEGYTKEFLGPDPAPELKDLLVKKAKETIEFSEKWEMQLREAAKRLGPEIRDQLDD